MSKKIALLGKELFVREEIQIDELFDLYPTVFSKITENLFILNEDYIIDGLHNIILKVGPHDDIFDKCIRQHAALSPFLSIRFVISESSENIWVRQTTDSGIVSPYNWFKFDDVYVYDRPNQIYPNKDYRNFEFMIMKSTPVTHLTEYYKIKHEKNRGVIPIPL